MALESAIYSIHAFETAL